MRLDVTKTQSLSSHAETDSRGRRPLHEAAVRGDPTIVHLLLSHGADPNVPDAAGETPLMVACRHNRLTLVHELIRYGSRIDAIDLAHRSLLHHVTFGNSVLVAHYLLQACGLSSVIHDGNLQSPLHIACSVGHVEIFLFLLNKKRSNVLDQDLQGNTPLHLASKYGHSWHCFELVRRAGCHLLSVRNNDGRMASDVARRAKYLGLSRSLDTMRYESRRRQKEVCSVGPVKLWYMLVVMPWIMLPVVLVLTWLFDNAALFVLLGSIWLSVVDLYYGHRIDHFTRWPNPAHASNFAAGFLYTFLCFYVIILPELYNKLSVYFLAYTSVSTLILLAMYWRLMTSDPGACTESVTNPKTGLAYTIVDVAEGADGLGDFCIRCEVVRPPKTVHCRLCNCCYRHRDHHCVYLFRCIAADNHSLFISFAALSVICMITFESLAVYYVVSLHRGNFFHPQLFIDVFYRHPFVWPLFILNGISLGWLAVVFGEAFLAYIKYVHQEIGKSTSVKLYSQLSA